MQRQIFTSESVTEGHPDKIADQISDAVLDAVMAEDPLGRVACEVLVTTGICVVAGEITTTCYVDVPRVVRNTIQHIGYADALWGFDCNTCGVLNAIQSQSPDIAIATGWRSARRRYCSRSPIAHRRIRCAGWYCGPPAARPRSRWW